MTSRTTARRKAAMVAALVVGLASTAAFAQPTELEGVKLAPTVQVGAATLQLNGAGVRTRAIFSVYVTALYVPQKATDAAALLAQKGPRRITLTMLRNVDGDTFAEALNDGLRKNHSEAQIAAFKGQIETLNTNLRVAGEARKGDVIQIEFTPETGTRITVNGQAKGSAIPGEDFYTAVMRIWLGERPVDSGLKKGLLGG